MAHRMRLAYLLPAAAAFAATTAFAAAADATAANPAFTGAWKSDSDLSPAPVATFSYARAGAGLRFSNGAYLDYTLRCDGKPAPMHFEDNTLTCTETAPDTFHFTVTRGETILSTTTDKLSDGGRTLTDERIERRADTSTRRSITVYLRTAGNPRDGLAGTWQARQTTSDPLFFTYRVTGDQLTLAYPARKLVLHASLDGTPVPLADRPDATISITLESPNRLHLVERAAGKPFQEIVDTLSPDGDTISSVQWLAGKPSEKTTTIYEKQ